MIKRLVKMSFHPEKVEAFKKVFAENWKQIKGFEGCSHVELLQDENNPSVFFTYSLWQSEEHVNRYRESELFGRVWGQTKVYFNDRPQAWTVKMLDFDQ
jgi:heme oxygenase (mycobilin-producing)